MENIVSQPTPLSEAEAVQNCSVSLSTRTGLVLLLLLSIFAVAPLFYPGYLQVHTGFIPLWNITDLRANFGNLSWTPHLLVQIDPVRGAGLLPYYVAALLPFSAVVAVKIVFAVSWLLAGTGMYLWLRGWLGNAGALVAGVVYVYLPFYVTTVYVRGSWAESLFWGLLPWAMLAATFLVTSPRLLLLPLAAGCWLALGLTQLGLTIWALLFLICLVGTIHPRQAWLPVLAGVGGVVAAVAVYLIIAPNRLLLPPPVPFADHYLLPFQLVSAFWGPDISRAGWDDGLSLQLGLAAVGLTIISLYYWRCSVPRRADRRITFFVIAALLFLLPLLGLPAGFWALPGRMLTYPWQLLGFAGLCLAVLAGAALWIEPRFSQLPLLAAIVIVIILSVYPQLLPQFVSSQDVRSEPPLAEFGEAQLSLLDYGFAVKLSQDTQPEIESDPLTEPGAAGVDDSDTMPLAQYGPLRPGDNLLLNVSWQPHQPFAEDLKIFVHLVDAENRVVAQFDGQPRQGAYPTSAWIPGEIIADAYALQLPADASPGPYRVFVGLYNESSLIRLPAPYDNEGRAIFDVQ